MGPRPLRAQGAAGRGKHAHNAQRLLLRLGRHDGPASRSANALDWFHAMEEGLPSTQFAAHAIGLTSFRRRQVGARVGMSALKLAVSTLRILFG